MHARTPLQARCEDTIGQTVSVLTASQNGYSINTGLSYKTLIGMEDPERGYAYVLGPKHTEFRVRLPALYAPTGQPSTLLSKEINTGWMTCT